MSSVICLSLYPSISSIVSLQFVSPINSFRITLFHFSCKVRNLSLEIQFWCKLDLWWPCALLILNTLLQPMAFLWNAQKEAISEFKQANQANWLRIMMLGFLMHIQSGRKESMKFNCTIKLSGENIYWISSRITFLWWWKYVENFLFRELLHFLMLYFLRTASLNEKVTKSDAFCSFSGVRRGLFLHTVCVTNICLVQKTK